MANNSGTLHENSYFTTHVIVADDNRLFISIDPSDPQRLSVLGTGAQVLFALAELTSPQEAYDLSALINEFARQFIIIVDSSHALLSSSGCVPLLHQ